MTPNCWELIIELESFRSFRLKINSRSAYEKHYRARSSGTHTSTRGRGRGTKIGRARWVFLFHAAACPERRDPHTSPFVFALSSSRSRPWRNYTDSRHFPSSPIIMMMMMMMYSSIRATTATTAAAVAAAVYLRATWRTCRFLILPYIAHQMCVLVQCQNYVVDAWKLTRVRTAVDITSDKAMCFSANSTLFWLVPDAPHPLSKRNSF